MTGGASSPLRPSWRHVGADWKLARLDGRRSTPVEWMPATVPGAV
jgi:hypothetical protein